MLPHICRPLVCQVLQIFIHYVDLVKAAKKVAGRAFFNWQYTRSQFQVAPENYANYACRCLVNMILEQFAHLSTG